MGKSPRLDLKFAMRYLLFSSFREIECQYCGEYFHHLDSVLSSSCNPNQTYFPASIHELSTGNCRPDSACGFDNNLARLFLRGEFKVWENFLVAFLFFPLSFALQGLPELLL
jgi:hypothetical protein